MEQLATENNSLNTAQRIAAEISQDGGGILTSLDVQQATLKGVKDKTKEMARQLGLSDSILTLIERRGKSDLLIFLALAVALLVFIYMLAYYVKPAMNTENMMWLAGMGGKTAV